MGKLLLGVALCMFYFLWLRDVVPPHVDIAARKLGYQRFVRVSDLQKLWESWKDHGEASEL